MNTDTETAEAVTEPTTEATQAELQAPDLFKPLFDPARLPERVEGFTYHPDLALMVVDGELNDERIDPAKVAAAGFSLQIVEKSNGLDVSDWTPEGDGQLVAIYDNEHGTFAAFVTPKEATPAEPDSEPAEFPSGYTDAEPEILLEGTRSIARESLLGDLMHSMLDEVKAIPDVWQKLPQYKQDQVLARIEGRSRTILGRVVEIIAADARPSIPANVESVTVKDGIGRGVSTPHTRGPWFWSQGVDDWELVGAGANRVLFCWNDRTRWKSGLIIGENIKEADARLIAAAPDMYEALKDLVDDICDREDVDSPSCNPGRKSAVKWARAALAKAGKREVGSDGNQ